jgi:hypothetical protein
MNNQPPSSTEQALFFKHKPTELANQTPNLYAHRWSPKRFYCQRSNTNFKPRPSFSSLLPRAIMCNEIIEKYGCGHLKKTKKPKFEICEIKATNIAEQCPRGLPTKAERSEKWDCGKCSLNKLIGAFDKSKSKKAQK